MKVFAFVGLPATGKTFHAERISKEFKIPLIETGQILYEEVKKRGLSITKDNVKKVWEELKREDPAILTRLAIKKMKETNEPTFLILSPKCMKEVELLRDSFEECYLIAFIASPRTRFRRAVELRHRDTKAITKEKREELADINTIEKFREYRDDHEIRLGIGKVIALADYYVNTETTQEEANFEIKRIFEELR